MFRIFLTFTILINDVAGAYSGSFDKRDVRNTSERMIKPSKGCRGGTLDGKLERRSFLSISTASCWTFLQFPGSAAASQDPLFKPNPLTNKVLEQVRILDQAAADNVQYSGELVPGTAKIEKKSNYAMLLKPIVSMRNELMNVDILLTKSSDGPKLNEVENILSQKQYEKLNFKKTFNLFADNIYYADPDRANAYLGGGAIPKNEQSIAYLLRNDILNNLESLQAEVSYQLKEQKTGKSIETEDLFEYSRNILKAFNSYLELVPPNELQYAEKLL